MSRPITYRRSAWFSRRAGNGTSAALLITAKTGRAWIDHVASAAATAARLASGYLDEVRALASHWRARLSSSAEGLRSDAAAWAIIDLLPAYPMISGPVAAAATGRSKPQVYRALDLLEEAGVLLPLTQGKRNRSWEASGLLHLLAGLEAGEPRTK